MEFNLEKIYEVMREKEKLREELLLLTREINRLCAKSTRKVHQGKIDDAKKLLEKALTLNKELGEYREKLPEMYYSISYTCQQEIVEAFALLRVIENKEFPAPDEVGVEPEPYLTGLADLIGELRRYVLELLKKKNLKEVERILTVMEELFDELMIFDLPEKMIPGLRKKIDGARAIIDRTKSHYLMTLQMNEVVRKLER